MRSLQVQAGYGTKLGRGAPPDSAIGSGDARVFLSWRSVDVNYTLWPLSSDEELMAAYVAGELSAFDELFARYAPLLLRVMRQQLRSQEEANDLVQQTFLQLHRARHDFRTDAKLRPWLFTIALNLKREHLRRLKRRPEAELELDGRNDPSAKTEQARFEAAKTLNFALDKLRPGHREVIELHWLGQLSFPEISELLGTSLSAVKVRAHRGYAALRQILQDDTE